VSSSGSSSSPSKQHQQQQHYFQQQQQQQQQKQEEEGVSAATAAGGSCFRSRTDSQVAYSPGTAPEAPGASAYINKRGELELSVLLKVSLLCSGP